MKDDRLEEFFKPREKAETRRQFVEREKYEVSLHYEAHQAPEPPRVDGDPDPEQRPPRSHGLMPSKAKNGYPQRAGVDSYGDGNE